jgi:hypothetical protein
MAMAGGFSRLARSAAGPDPPFDLGFVRAGAGGKRLGFLRPSGSFGIWRLGLVRFVPGAHRLLLAPARLSFSSHQPAPPPTASKGPSMAGRAGERAGAMGLPEPKMVWEYLPDSRCRDQPARSPRRTMDAGAKPARRWLDEDFGGAPPSGRAHTRWRIASCTMAAGREDSARSRSATASSGRGNDQHLVTFETDLGGRRKTPETRPP